MRPAPTRTRHFADLARSRTLPTLITAIFTALSMPTPSWPQPTTDPMPGMSAHMYLTPPRPTQPGDRAKAEAIVAAAKTAMAPYQDFHKAEADGY